VTGFKHSGRPLALDANARTKDSSLPAFLSKPDGAAVYHGFPVLTDVCVDGFTLGMITDFLLEPADEGDAFVVAPDGSRAGLNWEHTSEEHFSECLPLEEGRWGVWNVSFPFPMDSREMARRNLAHILPKLIDKWQLWRSSTRKS
jgi:hypothetical protein